MKASKVDDIGGGDDFFDEYCFDSTHEQELVEGIVTLPRVESSSSNSSMDDQSSMPSITPTAKKAKKSSLKRCGSKVNVSVEVPVMKAFFSGEGDLSYNSLSFEIPAPKPRMKLYVYPTFDRSDSSLFLPSKLARHLNSGNMASVSTLIRLNFDKNCKIDMDLIRCDSLTPRCLFKFYGLFQERHVDSIRCVRQTTVTENQITSVLFIKFTSSRVLDAAVRKNVRDPDVKRILACEHQCLLHNPFKREDHSPEEFNRLEVVYNSPGDKEIYVTQEMTLTMDPLSKKVTHFKTVHRVTSMALAPPPLPDSVL